jgi:hypothetical protein
VGVPVFEEDLPDLRADWIEVGRHGQLGLRRAV